MPRKPAHFIFKETADKAIVLFQEHEGRQAWGGLDKWLS